MSKISEIETSIVGKEFKSNNYGVFVIEERVSSVFYRVKFIETGSEYISSIGCIKAGRVKDHRARKVFGVGFIGVGQYKSRSGGRIEPAYIKWTNMLMRCYDHKYISRYPTYAGCSVCSEWFDYQAFAKWFHENVGDLDKSRCHLDKDIKQRGVQSKIYSPDTCMLISAVENTFESSSKYYEIVQNGSKFVVRGLSEFCREKNLNYSSVKNVLNGASRCYMGITSVRRVTDV